MIYKFRLVYDKKWQCYRIQRRIFWVWVNSCYLYSNIENYYLSEEVANAVLNRLLDCLKNGRHKVVRQETLEFKRL